jgi:hypothetical protein
VAASGDQSKKLMVWARQQVALKRPAIIGVVLSNCGRFCDSNYDHIIPVSGVCSNAATPGDAVYRVDDTLKLNGLYSSTPAWRRFDSMPGTPITKRAADACKYTTNQGGCIAKDVGFGVSVLGVMDADGASLPVKLAVNASSEPNMALNKKPGYLKGTVTVSGLTAGAKYSLLRFNGAAALPTKGGAAAFVAAAGANVFPFTATSATYTWVDPKSITTDSVVYYRAVATP